MHGGDLVAEVLERQGVRQLFTLCGGHISPILTGAKSRGIAVIDVRDEATAVFAADAVARLTGIPGVAAVTAGPGVTNTITAIKNAQLAQSPVVLIGGATATVLRGRGALQDIDQLALFAPHVKSCESVGKVKDLVGAMERAFALAQDGVPGPVFVETPVDLLYDESTVREMIGAKAASDVKGLVDSAIQLYLRAHMARVFAGYKKVRAQTRQPPKIVAPFPGAIERAAKLVREAARPVVLVGSQATVRGPEECKRLASALERIGAPVYLSGMARGLLGAKHSLLCRHKRTQALREADVVVLAGVPCDFRLNYGLHIGRKAKVVALNRSDDDARKNRRPQLAIIADPCESLLALARELSPERDAIEPWRDRLRTRDRERNDEIAEQAKAEVPLVHPLRICAAIDGVLPDDSVLVADGGDFVATASYVTAPRGPLSWLDPGVFGTLGVGAGFALGAKLVRPDAEVWLIWGDGSAGYGLAEIDTFVRHGLGMIAVVGNDASWAQIARDQVGLLGDDVGTVLRRSDYHKVAEALGGAGLLLDDATKIGETLARAQELAKAGKPVLINVHLSASEFRKGSISM
ncbi:MAG TPA: thiamine pyrophosphate-binding protein [Nannocystaceae bacterium]|nr:thiamine pyrophosphate-binding protein [Nannocystaceae bacterium]